MANRRLSFRRLVIVAGLGGFGVGLLALVYLAEPGSFSLLPRCLFHQLTGLYCPGCGSTRAVHLLLHGEFLASFRMNPLYWLFAPLLAWVGFVFLRAFLHAEPLPTLVVPPWLAWSITAAIIGFFILRNLPWYPFTLLAPPGAW